MKWQNVKWQRWIVVSAFGIAALGGIGGASAAISPVDVSCTNPAGHLAGGQQPTCEGVSQTQETENQNPAGHAPSGQNK